VVLQFFTASVIAAGAIDFGIQDDKAGPPNPEICTYNNKALLAHSRAGARYAIGQQQERVRPIERFRQDPDGAVVMVATSGSVSGAQLSLTAESSCCNTSCTSGRMQSIWMCSWFWERPLAELIARLIADRGKVRRTARSTYPRSRQASAK
jgi:hypothetical protein